MFNEEETLILTKDARDITANIVRVTKDIFYVKYENCDKIFPYQRKNLTFLTKQCVLPKCHVTTTYHVLSNIDKIIKFGNYLKIFFKNGFHRLYLEEDLIMEYDLLQQEKVKNVFYYLKEMANLLAIDDVIQTEVKEKEGKGFLSWIYEKIDFINDQSVIRNYLLDMQENSTSNYSYEFFYPFSFNLSQKSAIKNAFHNQVSIIEGPPGTGKTQTILNIIANAIMTHKTVAVLSNNNSATDNVFEKLDRQGLAPICAKLGRNKIDGNGYQWTTSKQGQVQMPTKEGNATQIGNTGNGYAKITYLGS